MIRPVGPKGRSGEFPVTKVPSGAANVSKIAQGKLQKAVLKATKFEAEKRISNREEAETAEDVAFKFFEDINEANGQP